MSDTPTDYTGPQRVLSGMQPTGSLHLGNYLGALKNWVSLQEDGNWDCFYCVVDLHAITMPHDPATLPDAVRSAAAAYIASGVDPSKSAIFAQSAVPAHAELAWIFNCVARLGWLERMTQFKDKAGKDKERASVGLFTYPVLQAADILVYKATHVPVGEDQKQHLELCRDIAARFNRDYGDGEAIFPITEPVIQGPGARVMSLRDGAAKMSKSDVSDNSRINLDDDADKIARKIKKAKTDPEPLPSEEAGLADRPEASNLVGIYAALTGKTKADILAEFGGQGFGAFKPALADVAVEYLAPISDEYRRLVEDKTEIDRILAAGAERANAVAAPVVTEAKEIIGFWG
ncbi:MAG: tryptophan--tRNA ligase [Maricaulis sp.]|jgi:tryptophanyl-tRNA synthetase|uniref:tryptophan--tRNA ligase n=1 Tax=Maricaulis sp. TaxID=1486257 RepID=UPI001B2A137A|nr:tryptophan--tRNA ligase [Maricaulis sp.]MEC9250862.1 tryptophan--tRNA ligase [Pseudomonadota bacterium]MBO6728824.1 tryptophan--tRNA ligase [Maricaulis sp.]MBO6846183.1 tryptophan--tRNA ligase [Maricaulis sp.]MBO6875940.1 tryptophan--tRNA ligase [Maricaulis sp.]MDM7984975.1 tryptophan--tRNA ligase [Maricaulis sp.]